MKKWLTLSEARARTAENKKNMEAFNSVSWPSHVAFTDTTEEWELRMKGKRFDE